MKKILRRIINGKPSEVSRLLAEATPFPRYTPHRFVYKGLKFEVTDFLSVAWQIAEVFGEERLKFVSTTTQPRIIDCGANVGTTVMYFRTLFPNARITAFEADPNVFACLKRNLESNGMSDVDIQQKVVWTHADGASFGGDGADGGSVMTSANAVVLPSVRLRDVLAAESEVDLLKVDIEGAETKVITDCDELLRKVRFISVEYHSLMDQPQELDRLLAVLGKNGFRYSIHRIGTFHVQPFVKMEPGAMDLQLDIHAIRK
ncbi:MAG: FkbM family methyltransferase [Flavobacteriales bacterium]